MINLQEEFTDFITKKNYDWGIIRVLRDIKCPCVRRASGTPDPGCPNCEGAGYVFNEILIKGKQFYVSSKVAHAQDGPEGITLKTILTVYVEAGSLNDTIKISDYIFQVKQTLSGDPVDPIIRTRKWVITDVIDYRMQHGQLEFIKIYAKPTLL